MGIINSDYYAKIKKILKFIFPSCPINALAPRRSQKVFCQTLQLDLKISPTTKSILFVLSLYSTRLYTPVQAAHRVKADIDKIF